MYRIAAGSKCHIYKRGSGTDWRPYVTTKNLEFFIHGVTDNGGRWLFQYGDWLLKIPSCFVKCDTPDPMPKPKYQKFRPADRGKGVSRRRAMRSRKR